MPEELDLGRIRDSINTMGWTGSLTSDSATLTYRGHPIGVTGVGPGFIDEINARTAPVSEELINRRRQPVRPRPTRAEVIKALRSVRKERHLDQNERRVLHKPKKDGKTSTCSLDISDIPYYNEDKTCQTA